MTTLPTPVLTEKYLTNSAYGYPQGAERSVKPIALVCLHITANPSNPPATALQERNYANRAGSNGPSAHLYVNNDGSGIWAIDPIKYAAWNNGDVRSPRTTVPGIQGIVDFKAAGHNANEAYWLEIELCGRNPDYPISAAQKTTAALVIAQHALRTGLPIERSTVHLHGDLNTVTRASCPVPSSGREAWVISIISEANSYLKTLEDSAIRAENAALKLENAKLTADLAVCRTTNSQLNLDLQAAYQEVFSLEAELEEQRVLAEEREAELLGQLDAAVSQRDETLAWGKELQSQAASILANDPPSWAQ